MLFMKSMRKPAPKRSKDITLNLRVSGMKETTLSVELTLKPRKRISAEIERIRYLHLRKLVTDIQPLAEDCMTSIAREEYGIDV